MTLQIGTTSTFGETRDEIITDALVNLGVVAPGKSVTDARTAGLLAHASRALNRLVKAMDAEGQFLWRIVRRVGTLSTGLNTFSLNNDVLDLDEPLGIYAVLSPGDGSDRTPLVSMSRDDWMVWRHNSADTPVDTGRPTRYYFTHTQSAFVNDTIPGIVLDRNADVDYTVDYAAFVRSADFTSGSTNPNFPTKWIACLVYGLTAELAPAYRQPSLASSFRQLFAEEKARLLADDNERGNFIMVPFGNRVF